MQIKNELKDKMEYYNFLCIVTRSFNTIPTYSYVCLQSGRIQRQSCNSRVSANITFKIIFLVGKKKIEFIHANVISKPSFSVLISLKIKPLKSIYYSTLYYKETKI